MDPIHVALIGAGRRAWGVYCEFLPQLSRFLKLVAVCDPLKDSADKAAARLGVPAFYSLRELVRARPMEAAIVVTPVESHHAISVFLSRHGIHHICETSMASTLQQSREMLSAARENKVVLHINEQFFRREVIAFSRQIAASGVIGPVHRMTNYHAHVGYHNNSIFQVFAGARPVSVNAVEQNMPVRRHLDGAGRWHEVENYRLRFMTFANGFCVTDSAGNIKSALGRCPRPGYLEIDGTEGSIVEQPSERPAPWESRAEVRLVASENFARGAYAESYPIERIVRAEPGMGCEREYISERLPHGGDFYKLRVRLPQGTLEYLNPLFEYGITNNYLSTVAQSSLDFVRVLREGARPEFSAEQAVISAEMESAFARSVELGGGRVNLPFDGQTTQDEETLAALRKSHGVDPLDVEAMIDVAFPKNYVA